MIPGQPPDLANLPGGCPFAPRCRYRHERCIEERPVLEPVGVAERHLRACFGDE